VVYSRYINTASPNKLGPLYLNCCRAALDTFLKLPSSILH